MILSLKGSKDIVLRFRLAYVGYLHGNHFLLNEPTPCTFCLQNKIGTNNRTSLVMGGTTEPHTVPCN